HLRTSRPRARPGGRAAHAVVPRGPSGRRRRAALSIRRYRARRRCAARTRAGVSAVLRRAVGGCRRRSLVGLVLQDAPDVFLERRAEPRTPARRATALAQLDVERTGEAARIGCHEARALSLEDDAGLAVCARDQLEGLHARGLQRLVVEHEPRLARGFLPPSAAA